MERIASPEEKIRRAEEIYYRRRNETNRSNVARVNVNEQKNYGLFKKLVLQILICLVIYFIFYLIQNGNYIFSENVINKTKEVLSYDINIPQAYEQIKQFVNNVNTQNNNVGEDENNNVSGEENQENAINTDNTNSTNDENSNGQNVEGENKTEVENSKEGNENSQEGENSQGENNSQDGENVAGIGGADFEDVVLETKSQEQLDVEYLQTYSWAKPLNGRITSEFGKRDSTSSIVSANHTGIDIAANTGTIIYAAIEGTVQISSTVGEYGYHIKISNGDVSTLYAHCSKLYVKVGDYIKQGQAIAEVGSTGKSTGPHLHFEVIRDGRYINPRNVLQF